MPTEEGLERTLAASRSGQKKMLIDPMSDGEDDDDEDDDLDAPVHIKDPKSLKHQLLRKDSTPAVPEATRLSKPGIHAGNANPIAAATSTKDQLGEKSTGMKRKAEEELQTYGRKRSFSTSVALNESSAGSSGLNSTAKLPSSLSPPTISRITITYPNGGLRITRTPGRQKAKNCVNLEDIIHKQHVVSACVFAFFIADSELFKHLPLSHTSEAIPIYIGRDANNDPMLEEACNEAGITFNNKLTAKQLQTISPNLRRLHSQQYGKNLHAFYAWSPGSSHSKILLLVYADFLRIVITSCNMMDTDTRLGDNHWYIHDVPKLHSRAKREPAAFETALLAHLQALSTPDAFIDSIRGMYDYSTLKVHLVTSVPGTRAGEKAEDHGLLRLRRVVRDLDMSLPKKGSELQLEVCTASIGNLSARWLNGFNACALGAETIAVADEDCAVPDLKIFYPTVADVRNAHRDAQDAASNIGCHTRPWATAPHGIKLLFHHYESKDPAWLFHQKLILAHNPRAPTAQPYYVYVGSANLSASAWGALEQDKSKRANKATCNMKLVRTSNFECGVVVPGDLVERLLEGGTESWREGIVPYVQSAARYDLRGDRPWNDPRWVQNYQADWKGS